MAGDRHLQLIKFIGLVTLSYFIDRVVAEDRRIMSLVNCTGSPQCDRYQVIILLHTSPKWPNEINFRQLPSIPR